MRVIKIVGAALLVSAAAINLGDRCAASESSDTGTKSIARGWAQARGREVRIYYSRKDLGKLFDGSCISGTMSSGRTLPKSLQGKYVEAYGVLIGKDELDAMAARLESIGVENYCNSSHIAIITQLLRRQAKNN